MSDPVAIVDDEAAEVAGTQELASLLIDLGETRLLVPNVCVAEIQPWRPLAPDVDSVSWHLGNMVWRDLQVPVISFAHLDDPQNAAAGVDRGACLLVMNRSDEHHRCKFFGLMGMSLPRMIHVLEEDLTEDTDKEALGLATGHAALLGSEPVIVPDLNYIGGQLDLAGLSVKSTASPG